MIIKLLINTYIGKNYYIIQNIFNIFNNNTNLNFQHKTNFFEKLVKI